ncbi:twin-arginine translocase subunit TatB [Sphingomonas sp. H39-1-10]|uniref:twin-arginine translocase subunit TatB n=1 Tax=Sphingomonas pollutisoli TaxID=3030829 RepID=UPI0023B997B5|nr:twin-arginine translocase subunit TatB [Sphingomonas pollutisoli]MDF0488997.1 twin-arginine translocase subunit TatB [Sphingomonas pollutisoli]
MFDFQPMELVVLGTVAILVIPPKDLPKAMRVAGYWVGRMRGVAQQFRSGFDTMVREAELHEMEKKWAAENERIMREHPPTPALDAPQTDALDAPPVMPALPDSERHYSEDGPPIYVEHPTVVAAEAPAPVNLDKAAS